MVGLKANASSWLTTSIPADNHAVVVIQVLPMDLRFKCSHYSRERIGNSLKNSIGNNNIVVAFSKHSNLARYSCCLVIKFEVNSILY